MVEKQSEKYIKILRSDNGGEYVSGALKRYYKDKKIQQQFWVSYTPQQKRVWERRNRTMVECANIMLQGENFSNGFWNEAIYTVVYLKTSNATKKLDLLTTFEFFHGYKPKVNHLRVFGCKDFAHIPKYERRKFDANSIECIFVGYCNDQKAYKLFHSISHNLIASRDVVFHENTNKNYKMNDSNVWPIFTDIDYYVKLDAIIQKNQEHEKVQEQVQDHGENNMNS